MKKNKITSAILAACMLATQLNFTVYAQREVSAADRFTVSECGFLDKAERFINNDSLKSANGGPVVYGTVDSDGASYHRVYNKADGSTGASKVLKNEAFDMSVPYMCYGTGTQTELTDITNSIIFYINTLPETVKLGDGIYFSFYYRSKSSFIGADSKQYTGETTPARAYMYYYDESTKTKNPYAYTRLDSAETKSDFEIVPDDEWHRIDFSMYVSETHLKYLKKEGIRFYIALPDVTKAAYIDFAGFRSGVLSVSDAAESNNDRMYTEMSWRLKDTRPKTLTVNGMNIETVKEKNKYIVRSNGSEPVISLQNDSGTKFRTVKTADYEYTVYAVASGYDFLKPDSGTVTLRERIDPATGKYKRYGKIRTFDTPQSELFTEKCTIIVTDNVIESGMRNLPQTELFSDGVYSKNEYEEWLNNGLPENMAEEVLLGNFAFVADSPNYWAVDRKETASEAAAIMRDGKFFVLSELALNIFGVSSSEKYVSVDKIEDESGISVFTDSEEFLLLSRNIEQSINTNPVDEKKGLRQYTSYYAVSAAIGEITWNEINPTDSDWDAYMKNWQETLIMPEEAMSQNEDYIKELIDTVSGYMSEFDSSTGSFGDGCAIGTVYARTREMAKCCKTLKISGRNDIDTEVLTEEIKALLEYLYKNDFSDNAKLAPSNNWFMNLVTYPMQFADSLLLMRDEISDADMQKYVNTWMVITGSPFVTKFQVPYKYDTHDAKTDLSNPCSNYTNLLWRSHAALRLAVLKKDASRANSVLKYLNGVFRYTGSNTGGGIQSIKDGFYRDGGFVFHTYYAYNTGYGNSYAAEIAELLCTTGGTVFDIRNVYGYENIYGFAENSWIPLIYSNQLNKFAAGRELPKTAEAIISSIMIIMSYAPEDVKAKLGAKLRNQIKNDVIHYKKITARISGYYSMIYPEIGLKVRDIAEYLESLNVSEDTYSRVFASMDRVIHKKSGYTFMLAMSSDRIDRYEAINDSGYSDWYIGDGMTNMITNGKQYLIGWWSRADRYKIPGTTVDSTERNPLFSKYGNHNPENSWAGAVTDGNITAAGMILPGNILESESRLTAKKSWFMLDDKIICMGSDITGGNGRVYTTVDNIWQNKSSDSAVVDGKQVVQAVDTEESFENARYAWTNENKGYVFVGDNKLICERTVKDKRYVGYSKTSAEPYDPFFTMILEHGKNNGYCYVILPNVSEKQTAEYSENPDFEIIESDSAMHAVRIKRSGTVMANIYEPSVLCGISFDTPCSVILTPYGNGYKISLSDPTQKRTEVKLTLPKNAKVTGKSFTENGNTIAVDVSVEAGGTYSIVYSDFDISKTDSGYRITELSKKGADEMLIFGVYRNNRLVETYLADDQFSDVKAESDDEIRAFLWKKNICAMQPLKEKSKVVLTNQP